MTDTEKAALEARIDELCAENERLRQENQSVGMAAYELGRASLADENAKLRELAKDMRACFRIGAERDGISKQWCYELFVSYTDKLRELGVDDVLRAE